MKLDGKGEVFLLIKKNDMPLSIYAKETFIIAAVPKDLLNHILTASL